MLQTVLLLAILATHTSVRVAWSAFDKLDLDPWQTLVWLGLAEAEDDVPARERLPGPRQSRRAPSPSGVATV